MSTAQDTKTPYPWAGAGFRWAAAVLAALAYGLASYVIVDLVRPDAGFFSVSFAILQPAVLSAFVAWLGDPHFLRRRRYYLLVPVWLMVGMWVVSIVVLREGTICIVMLSPIWLASGLIGTMILEWARREAGDGNGRERIYAGGLFVLPLVMLPLESAIPVPEAHHTVSRSVVIDADAGTIWPLMQGMGDLRESEGVANFSQDVAGLPRPLSARLEGQGVGARRLGIWQHGIHFAEIVDRWEDGRAIGWTFDFSDSAGWEFTDVHLHPASEHMKIRRGGYELEPLADGRRRLTLHTEYTARTHLNAYAAMWGELFLGDISDNLLAAIRNRAEAAGR